MSATRLSIIGLVVVAAIGLFIGYTAISGPGQGRLSTDQQELVDEAGYPDTFVMIKDGERRDEIWNYYSMQASFYFSNGEYVRADNTLEPLPDDAELPDFKPESFPPDVKLSDIAALAEGDPHTTKLNVKGLGNIEGRQYEEGLFVGQSEGKPAYIQTQAFRRVQ